MQPCCHFPVIVAGWFGPGRFDRADDWLKDNLPQMGGKATLVVLKDGKILCYKSEKESFTRAENGHKVFCPQAKERP